MRCFAKSAEADHLRPDKSSSTGSYREVHRVLFSDDQKYVSTDARSANLCLVDADHYPHEGFIVYHSTLAVQDGKELTEHLRILTDILWIAQ
eukprot:126272-Pyramimonas_sp.AAC.1